MSAPKTYALPCGTLTAYTVEAVDMFVRDSGMSEPQVQGAIVLLRSEILLDTPIVSTDGSGRATSLREIGDSLKAFTQYDHLEWLAELGPHSRH